MKKRVPKLFLSRETLAHLTHSQLEGAEGRAGTNDKSCLLSCFTVGCTDTCPHSIVRTCVCP